MGKDKSKAWEITKGAIRYTNPLLGLIVDATEKTIDKAKTATDSGDIQKLQIEVQRQEIALRMAEFQAKVAQEVAIARRIDTAEDVEIEEFYDTSGKGKIGINAKTEGESLTVGAGVSGEGRRVTKRIYRFRGWRDGGLEVIEQIKE
jgi:hypothetical protein